MSELLHKKKAQIAIEFISYVGLTIVVVIALSVVALDYTNYSFNTRQVKALENLAYATQEEFLLASQVQEGYQRTFNLPSRTVGGEYTLLNDNTSITFQGDHSSISLEIPHSTGTLIKGENNITNNNGIIIIN